MNLQQLHYFKTLSEVLSFTKAADKLCITQPSLSHSIHDLEEELQLPLFIRNGRNIKLTKYGATYLNYVIQAISILEAGRAKMNEYILPTQGTVMLSYLSSLTEYVPYLISLYRLNSPNIQTSFRMEQLPTGQIEDNLLNGQSNIGFSSKVLSDQLNAFYLGAHPSVIIVSEKHPWADRLSISLSELDGQDFVTYTSECGIRGYIDDLFKATNIHPKITAEVMYDNLIIGMVSSNFGVGIIPKPLGIQPCQCRCIPIQDVLPLRDIYLLWPKRHYLPPAAQQFMDFIKKNNDIHLDYFIDRFSSV